MRKLLTHEEADRQVLEAMGNPSGQAMSAFQNFLFNRGNTTTPQLPGVPKLPKEQIKKLPLRTQ